MAKATWHADNQGFSRYVDWSKYVTKILPNGNFQLTYDNSGGDYDPTQYAWTIEVHTADVTTTVVEGGPRDGETIYTGGTMHRMNYYDQSGDLMLAARDFDMSLTLLESWISAGSDTGWNVWQYLGHFDNVMKGSSPASNDPYFTSDVIQTGRGDDTVKARGGSDLMADGGGEDVYNGGAGFDRVDYSTVFWTPSLGFQGIDVDLVEGTVEGPDGNIDTLINVEGAIGTQYDDTFLGDARDNTFSGLHGNDTFEGGQGFDIVDYGLSSNVGGVMGVNVNLAQGTATDAFGQTDSLTDIEGVEGTAYDDILKDDGNDNYIRGRDGDDMITMRAGSDFAEGGAGADRFIFRSGSFGFDTIADFSKAEGDKIEIAAATSFSELDISGTASETVITYKFNTVVLEGVNANTIDATDFIF